MTTTIRYPLALVVGLIFGLALATDGVGQIPGVSGGSRPSTSGSSPVPNLPSRGAASQRGGLPIPTKRDRDQRRGTTPQPGGAAPARPGAPVPAGARPRPKPAEIRAAKRAETLLRNAFRATHTERLAGTLTLIDRTGRRFERELLVVRRFDRTGGGAVIVKQARGAELPPVAHLGTVDAKGVAAWWTHVPEERSTRSLAGVPLPRLEGSALSATDLLPLDPNQFETSFVETTVVDGKPAVKLLLVPASLESLDYHHAVATVRTDVNMIARLEFRGADETVLRSASFGELRYFGVHRRWTTWLYQDLMLGSTAVVRFDDVVINRDVDASLFAADRLPEFLAATPAPIDETR